MHPAAVSFPAGVFCAKTYKYVLATYKQRGITTTRLSSKLQQTAVVVFQALKAPNNRVGCLAL